MLRHCRLGIRKRIWPVKKLSSEVLAWLSVWSEVQMICMWSSWCHCHPIISCSSKIRIGLTLTFRLPSYPGCPGKRAIKWVYVCPYMHTTSPSPPVDNVWAMRIARRTRAKIVRTVLCCVVYNSCAQWYSHTCEQFLKLNVSLWSPCVIGQTIYIFILSFILLSFFFSSPNLSCRRVDVCHTSTHRVALIKDH